MSTKNTHGRPDIIETTCREADPDAPAIAGLVEPVYVPRVQIIEISFIEIHSGYDAEESSSNHDCSSPDSTQTGIPLRLLSESE